MNKEIISIEVESMDHNNKVHDDLNSFNLDVATDSTIRKCAEHHIVGCRNYKESKEIFLDIVFYAKYSDGTREAIFRIPNHILSENNDKALIDIVHSYLKILQSTIK